MLVTRGLKNKQVKEGRPQTPPQPIKKHNTGVYPYCDSIFVHGQLWKDFSNKLEKPADVLTQNPVKTTPSVEGIFQQVGKTG